MLVKQTTFGPHGNCYLACLATILDIPIETIPNFRGESWGPKLNEWLFKLGWSATFYRGDKKRLDQQTLLPMGWSIMGHQCLNGQIHSAVFKDGKLFHDPSPRPFCRDDVKVLIWTVLEKT